MPKLYKKNYSRSNPRKYHYLPNVVQKFQFCETNIVFSMPSFENDKLSYTT